MGVFLFGQPFYNLQLLTSNSSIDPEDCCSMENNFFFIYLLFYFPFCWSQNVYQKNGNLFFRTTIQKATASEQSKKLHLHLLHSFSMYKL